jgi:DNA-binding MarR family transcriptional regulator
MDAATELRQIINGYQVSQAVHVAATLGISDLLGQRPQTVGDLALATGSHEPSLVRLLRALVAAGLYSVRRCPEFRRRVGGVHRPTGILARVGSP